MNRQRIFRRNGQPLRSQGGPHALIILGIDNLGALEDLFGEPLGGEIIAAPVTYLSNGRQQVTIAAGHAIFTFALPE